MTFVPKVPTGSSIEAPDDGLGGHVQHQVEGPAGQGRLDGRCVSQVDQQRFGRLADLGQVEEAGPLVRRLGEAGHLRAHAGEPDRRPGSLEAGVAGQQYPLARPEPAI